MRYPYDTFITFLVTRKADINGTLKGLGLPELSKNEVLSKNILTEKLPPSVGSFIRSDKNSIPAKSKKSFIEWTEAHGLRELWEIQPEFIHTPHRKLTAGSRSMKVACDLFASANKRTALSLLLMRDFDLEDIINAFEEHFNVILDEEILTLSKKYFFDFDEMDSKDWNNLLNGLNDEESDRLLIGRQQHSKQFVEHAIGIVPKLTFEEILNDIMATSYYKFKALVNQPLMDGLAQRWANMAMVAGERKARFTAGDKRTLREDIQLQFDFEETVFPTLSELAIAENE